MTASLSAYDMEQTVTSNNFPTSQIQVVLSKRERDHLIKRPGRDYYVVPISRACTAIYLGGNVALHGLITHCTLINFRKCGLHVFYLDHFL